MIPDTDTPEADHSLDGLLGYLNFSSGKPDPQFQKQANDAFGKLAETGVERPWQKLREELEIRLEQLETKAASPFKDVSQARSAIQLVFIGLIPAYRVHHQDLLVDLSDDDLFAPFFLVRAFEAVLAQGGPHDERDRILGAALSQLNDYVGHRPVAILENRPKGEPYGHERVRPIPLYIRGAGVAFGRYHELISQTLHVLSITDSEILSDAQFDPNLLDELALDPRPYDQGHPAHRRPNYVFGEWDPDLLDQQARYRRFVLRRVVLDALLARATNGAASDDTTNPSESMFESAVVLAGTMLMAAGIRGSGPSAHDSSATLATLIPNIARYRDTFYAAHLKSVAGSHGERLRLEASKTKQPFGGVRQYLNDYLATDRARQVQHRQLALLYSAMGYPEASRDEALKISVPSVRILSAIHSFLAEGLMLTERADVEAAAQLLPQIEDAFRRGIDCGALADPWNILGFQALFPLSPAREDSVRDTRVDDLIFAIEQSFLFYSRLMSEAAATGNQTLVKTLKPAMRRFSAWWDRYASVEVSDVRRVHGGEAVDSAVHVAAALGRWHDQGEATGDLAFWKQHLERFHSPKAFAVVVAALLGKRDYRAAMALLINWIEQSEQVPLEDGNHSFYSLALRWMLGVSRDNPDATLVRKFFDYLEANAGDYWHVPSLDPEQLPMPTSTDDEDDLFGAAYEGMTYRDTSDDGAEGSVFDEGEPRKEFVLEAEAEPLGKRLRFLSALAQLWQVAVRGRRAPEGTESGLATSAGNEFEGWLATARENLGRLMALLDALDDHKIPRPTGSHESLVEYDRHRILKEQLQYATIGTCLDTALAVGALRGASPDPSSRENPAAGAPRWESTAVRLEAAIWRGDPEGVRQLLPVFMESFRSERLIFTALADGGQPRLILRARMAQSVLRALVVTLPRLGLLRETFELLRSARAMEQANRPEGRGVSEFNSIFQIAFTSTAEAIVNGTRDANAHEVAKLLEQVTGKFVKLWAEYSQSLHLSALDAIRTDDDWKLLHSFIRKYGRDLFHTRFLTLANLRGVLHNGVGAYLDYLAGDPDPLHPVRLVEDLDVRIARADAQRMLGTILHVLIENYEEYKDYNATASQSDYGENLFMLLDFLRLKALYERQAWLFQPLSLAHEVLARHERNDAALEWEEGFTRLSAPVASRFLHELSRLEQHHGIRLRTVADRLNERFVQSLAVDRLCALIGPAMKEAHEPGNHTCFNQLQAGVAELAARPVGVGLDVPNWLRRLENEIQRVQATQSAVNVLAEQQLRVPQLRLTLTEIQAQLKNWDDSAASQG